MRNLETGKHIKLSNGDEYYICGNMLSNNAEYFLLLNCKHLPLFRYFAQFTIYVITIIFLLTLSIF